MPARRSYLCAVCGETDPDLFHHVIREGKQQATSKTYCRVHYNERQKVSHRGRREAVAERVLIEKFGVTRKEYDAQLEAQEGRCPGCGRTREEDIDNRGRRWPVDHDHETDAVRGILCWLCNLALGAVRDEPATLRRLADYAEQGGVWCQGNRS